MKNLHKFRKLLKIGLLLPMFIVSCQSNQSHVYNKPLILPILTLNPKLTRDRSSFMVARAIFGQLMSYDTFGNIIPGLAKSWEISDNGTTYRFFLNTNAKFHDGKSFTSKDVAYSIHFLAAPDSLVSRYFKKIDGYDDYITKRATQMRGVKVISDEVIEIKLSGPSFIFLAQLADPKIIMLPEKLNGNDALTFFKQPVGLGPYRLKATDLKTGNLVLERFEEYQGRRSNIQTINLVTLEKSAALERFLRGELQDLEPYYFEDAELTGLRNGSRLDSTSSYSTNFIFFNGRKSHFQNAQVRKKIYDQIVGGNPLEGCGPHLANVTGIIPKGLMGWSEISSKSTSLEHAAETVRMASLPRELRLIAYGSKPPICIIEPLIKRLKKIGIAVKFDFITEDATVDAFIHNKYDLLLDNLSVRGPEPFNLFTFFDPSSPHQLTFFKDSEISKKLSVLETLVGAQRASAYKELSTYITTIKHYAVPLYTDLRVYVYDKNVKCDSVPATILGNTPFESVDL